MKLNARIAATVAAALALALGGAGSALASHGADDPAPHQQGEHHQQGKKHKHRGGKHHQGHGADDGPRHT